MSFIQLKLFDISKFFGNCDFAKIDAVAKVSKTKAFKLLRKEGIRNQACIDYLFKDLVIDWGKVATDVARNRGLSDYFNIKIFGKSVNIHEVHGEVYGGFNKLDSSLVLLYKWQSPKQIKYENTKELLASIRDYLTKLSVLWEVENSEKND